MKKNKSNISNIIRKQRTFIPAVSLLVFTFFVFGPSDLYFGNAQELWFSINDILPIIAVAGIAVFTILNVVYLALSDAIKGFFAALVWGLGIALYMQGNFIQIWYGVLDGQEIDWGTYTGYGVVNTIFWGLCLIAPLVVCVVKNNVLKKIIFFSSYIIIAVQLVTLIFLGVTTKVEKKDIVVTTEGIYTLSKNKNIVVFILDYFDAQYMNEIVRNDPEFSRQFDGFIYYDNTVGMYPSTVAALPHLLTGIKYLNETIYNEYLDNAFRKTNFYNVLKKNNYVAGIYTHEGFLSKQIPDVIKNIVERVRITINNPVEFLIKLYQFTATKYFPHVLKRTIWMYSSEIDNYKDIEVANAPRYRFFDDVYFNKRLLEDGVDLLLDKNVFRFYHLQGAHPPYIYNEKVETVERTRNEYNQTKGALQIVLNYITQLKNLNIYDNTLMLIMGDHGGLEFHNKPLLMIKDRNSIDEFSISSMPVTYENIIPMLETNLSNDRPCTDFLRDVPQKNMVYYYYVFDDQQWTKQALPPIHEYTFSDGKSDRLYMKATGRIFYPNKIVTELPGYILGDTIVFGEDGNEDAYIITGFTGKGVGGRYSLGTYGEMRIWLTEKPSFDITVRVTGGLLRSAETVRIYVNGTFLEEKILTSGDWSFVAPHELIPDRRLDLSFEYIDPTSPFELGSGSDERIMAVRYKTMNLSEFIGYNLGDTIVFGEDGNEDDYIVTGFTGKGVGGRYSLGTYGEMRIWLTEKPSFDITVRVTGGLLRSAETVRIYVNGTFLEEKILTSGDWSFVAPHELIPDRWLDLSFEYIDPTSPFELGSSADKRIMAVRYKTMTLNMK